MHRRQPPGEADVCPEDADGHGHGQAVPDRRADDAADGLRERPPGSRTEADARPETLRALRRPISFRRSETMTVIALVINADEGECEDTSETTQKRVLEW